MRRGEPGWVREFLVRLVSGGPDREPVDPSAAEEGFVGTSGDGTPPSSASPSPPALDIAAALSLLGDDEEILRDALGIFLEQAPLLMEEIERHSREGDQVAIARGAHSMRGLAATLAAEAARRRAHLLEEAAHDESLETMCAHVPELRHELERALAAARSYLTGEDPTDYRRRPSSSSSSR